MYPPAHPKSQMQLSQQPCSSWESCPPGPGWQRRVLVGLRMSQCVAWAERRPECARQVSLPLRYRFSVPSPRQRGPLVLLFSSHSINNTNARS